MKNDMQENQPVTIDGAFMAMDCRDVLRELSINLNLQEVCND